MWTNDARWKGCEVLRSDDLKTEESEGALRRSEVKAWNSWRIFEREENTEKSKESAMTQNSWLWRALPEA